ncbi:FtsX-like permease family protein [Streptomyces sp. NRRL F-5053]|uniref:FtsX-like permease family protein n=1 Tax=Streptomyces sp. NRRL F-5053 TaxID=1463854 RepID=UPI0004C798B1|nr:ABC transporter permease [Streptomyces sp. NRRL F-5053]
MVFKLVRMTLRERKAGLVGAFVALVGASMLITAFGILLQSGLGSGVPPQRYAAADLVIGGKDSFKVTAGKTKSKPLAQPAPLSADVVDEVAGVKGVRRAVPDVTFPARVVNEDGGLDSGGGEQPSAGHSWSSAALGSFALEKGKPPRHTGEVVLDANFAERVDASPGDSVRLATTQQARKYEVTGVAGLRGADGPLRSAAVFFSDAEATKLYGHSGKVDAVGVLAAHGTDLDELAGRLDTRLSDSGAQLYRGDARSQVEFHDVASARSGLTEMAASLGATVVLIAMIVVASTLALNVHQRRRELALLRAVAATPRQVYKMMAAETLVVSLVASVIGCLPGILVARFMRAALSLVGMVPEDFEFSYGPLPMLVAVFASVVAAEVAAVGVARKAVAIRPVEAMGEAQVEQAKLGRGRVFAGVLLFLLGVAASLLPLFFGSVFAVAGAGTGGLIMVIAILLLAPPVVALASRMMAGPIRRRTGPHGFLAVANTRANARRLAAGIGPLTLAIGFAMVQLCIPTTTADAAQEQAEQGIVSDFTLQGGPDGPPQDVVEDAASVPGVEAATGVMRIQLHASRKVWGSPEIFEYQAQGVTSGSVSKTMDLGVTDGSLKRLRGNVTAISDGAAGTLGADVGDRVRLNMPDGTEVKPVVVAVYERGLGFGDVTLPQATVRAHSVRQVQDAVFVKAKEGTDHDKVGEALRGLTDRYPGLEVLGKGGLSAAQEQQATMSVLTSALPLVLVFGYLAISVANTLVLATLGRVREFSLLRLVGAPATQVVRMMRVEAGMVVVIAVAVGTVVPLLPMATVSLGLTGSPLPHIPVLMYLGIVCVSALIGLAAILLPTRLALRTRPVEGIGLRE